MFLLFGLLFGGVDFGLRVSHDSVTRFGGFDPFLLGGPIWLKGLGVCVRWLGGCELEILEWDFAVGALVVGVVFEHVGPAVGKRFQLELRTVALDASEGVRLFHVVEPW